MNLGSPSEPTEDFKLLLRCLQRVHTYSFTVQSDHAREYADEIAGACSMGYVTTLITPGSSIYGHHWKMTALGLSYLEQWAEYVQAEEEENFLGREEDRHIG